MTQEEQARRSVITKVEQQKTNKHRYNIYVDEQFAFALHEDLMLKHRLLKGEMIDQTSMESILREEEQYAAYLKALRIIGRRAHAKQEVRQKLSTAGYDAETIETVTARLLREGYLDDASFARQLAEQRIRFNRKGRNFVRQELKSKGISKEQVEETLEAIDAEDEYDGAVKLAERKWKSSSGDRMTKKRKTASYLLRRGYTQGLVKRVLDQISISDYENEETIDSEK